MNDIAKTVLGFIKKGTIQEAIDFFIRSNSDDKDIYYDLHKLSGRLNRCNDLFKIKGITTLEETKVEENKIVDELIRLLKNDKVYVSEIPLPIGIEDEILIISRNNDQKLFYKEFFWKCKFRNIKSVNATDFDALEPELKGEKPLIAIWNNLDLKACPEQENLKDIGSRNADMILERIMFMEDCMDAGIARYYMHYGEPLYFVSENRNWIYSANSHFALIARLKEMIDFINAKG